VRVPSLTEFKMHGTQVVVKGESEIAESLKIRIGKCRFSKRKCGSGGILQTTNSLFVCEEGNRMDVAHLLLVSFTTHAYSTRVIKFSLIGLSSLISKKLRPA